MLKDDLDRYIRLVWNGGWSYLPALKILVEHKNNLEFQETARYATILSRTAELLEEGAETQVIFRSVDDLVCYFKNLPSLKTSDEWDEIITDINKGNLAALCKIPPRVPEDQSIDLIEAYTEQLVKEMNSFLPSVQCPESKLREYTQALRECGAGSEIVKSILSKYVGDEDFLVWAKAQREYIDYLAKKHNYE